MYSSSFATQVLLIFVTVFLVLTGAVGCGRVDNTEAPAGSGDVDKKCPAYPVTYSDPFTHDHDIGPNGLPYAPWSHGIKDFCLIKVGTTTHLFHITDPGKSWTKGGETSFGHAVSEDLISWTTLSRIESLRTDPSDSTSWSDRSVWAPHVIESDGIYYMYYTGVEWFGANGWEDHWERIGLATSTDLVNWSRYDVDGQDGLILDGPDTTSYPWSRYSAGTGMHECRDPFIFMDGSQYVMFVVTKANNGSSIAKLVVAYATSPDLVNWTWGNYVDATWPGQDEKAESPNLVKAGSFYYLMWTIKGNAAPNGAVRIAYASNIFGPYTVMESTSPLFGLANETLVEPDRIVYAAFDDAFELHIKRELELPVTPSVTAPVYVREYSECDADVYNYISP